MLSSLIHANSIALLVSHDSHRERCATTDAGSIVPTFPVLFVFDSINKTPGLLITIIQIDSQHLHARSLDGSQQAIDHRDREINWLDRSVATIIR